MAFMVLKNTNFYKVGKEACLPCKKKGCKGKERSRKADTEQVQTLHFKLTTLVWLKIRVREIT